MAAARRSLWGLDLVNVFMADVKDGIGIYLSVYLLTVQDWDPGHIGIVIALPSFVSILVQSPAGGLIDDTRRKRLLLVLSSFAIGISCLVVIYSPQFWPVTFSQFIIGLVGPIFQPCISAITLGLVGKELMSRRVGRNESFNHAGNMLAAVAAMFIGLYISFEGIFYFSLLQCAALIGSVLLIRARDIDHEAARAAAFAHQSHGSFWRDSKKLLSDRKIAYFIAAVTLWNLANGNMLVMLGQKLGVEDPANSAYYLSLCIIIAQLSMVVVAPWVAKQALSMRRYLFVLSFLLIAVRAVLITVIDSRYGLISLQFIDGLGAGIYGVLSIVMMADLSQGTGRFNLLQGLTYAAMGLGLALSSLLGGYLVSFFGFNQSFLWLAAFGIFGAWFFWFFVAQRAVDPVADGHLVTKDL